VQNILTGIYSKYSGDATLKAAIPGGLHIEIAPQGTALSYATYMMVSGYPDYMLKGTRYEVVTIQFDIYADTNALRLAAYAALLALYDDARPTATGYSSIIMERTNQQLVRDGSQNELYRAVVTYECRYLKS
jgi:hypothetical protein